MKTSKGKESRSPRKRNFILLLLSAFLLIYFLGAILESLAVRQDLERYQPIGDVHTVLGKRMHIYCTGKAIPGEATVILEAATGDSLYTWYSIQQRISQVARVCSYDRAGYGWSESRPGSRTVDTVVRELSALLLEAGIAGPFVLVGHSYGGLPVRLFASQRPEEVQGLVLIDIVPADTLMGRPALLRYTWGLWPGILTGIGGVMSRAGLVRGLSSVMDLYLSDALLYLPKEVEPQARAQYLGAQRLLTSANEQLYIPRSAAMVHAAPLPGQLPVTSFISSVDIPDARVSELTEDFGALSGDSNVIVVDDAGHYIHLERPDLILSAIQDLLFTQE